MEWLIVELYSSSALFEPSKLSRIAMFILYFCEYIQNDKELLDSLVERIISNVDQFNCFDCLNISRAFKYVLMNSTASSRILHYFVSYFYLTFFF